ncbi:hypothetical protein EDD85DRAFT_956445 [Armillaria nabsnona]|nr:hypothetical protein EDD85DRAFT_956445 [Armillaria nabsnona]
MSAPAQNLTAPKDPAAQLLNNLLDYSPNDDFPSHEDARLSVPPEGGSDSRREQSPQYLFVISPALDNPAVPGLQDLLAACTQLIKIIKQHKKFSRESIQDLDNFANAPMIEECLAIILAATLETCDAMVGLQEKKAAESWEIKDSLKKLVKRYAKAFILSSTAKTFTGKGSASSIVQALWVNNAKNLPAEEDAAGGNVLLSFISEELSSICLTVKTKLNDTISMQDGDEDHNIAVVMAKLVGNSKKNTIPITLQLYMCLAIIHWHLVNYPTMAKENQEQTQYTRALNRIYEADKIEYG